jgi:CRP/FNR family transcriptional regulator
MHIRFAAQHLDKVRALARASLFSTLPQQVLEKLAERGAIRRLERGDMLYSENETASGLFIVADGELRSVRQNEHGREQVLWTAFAGAVLALVPVFDGGKYFSTVVADAPSMVIGIGHEDFRSLCRKHPELLWRVAEELASEIQRAAGLIESLALRNVQQRVAQYLVSVADDRAVSSEKGLVFELTLTRPEIASRLGTVREVVSRSLARLHERGLIVLSGGRLVTIPDLDALRRFSGAPTAAELHIR